MKMNKVPVDPPRRNEKKKEKQIKKLSDEKIKLLKNYSIQFCKGNAYGGGEKSKKQENPHHHANYIYCIRKEREITK